MAYDLYDVDGFVADLASNSGYSDMCAVITALKKDGPLKKFIDEGDTEDMEGCIKDIEEVLTSPMRTDIRKTLEEFKESLKKVKEIAIIEQ